MTDQINNTVRWKFIVSGALTILTLIVGWAFIEIRDLPKTYVTYEDARTNRQDVRNRLDRIEEKIDRILMNKGNRNE